MVIARGARPLAAPVRAVDDGADAGEDDVAIVDEDVAELIEPYLARLRDGAAALPAHIAAGALDEVRKYGHGLKGTGAMFGFPGLGVLGARLEESALRGDPVAAQEDARVLQDALSRARWRARGAP
jgi:hypothetical protein